MVRCCHGRQNDLALSRKCFNPSDETGGRLELQLTWKEFIITFIWSYNIDIKAIYSRQLHAFDGSRETSRPAGPPPLTGGAKNVCMTEVSDGNALHGAAQLVRTALFLPPPPLHICLVIQSFCRKILWVHSAERTSCF